ncbi:BTB/POZ domain-containing protein [Megavirus baoshan]|uniref:BTB/POZ domain-containing protein n=1 Tax=Megavirus baoshan TaxID=2496520 RepID=A0A3S8UY10_9VIRU|nr:BTB/POZ domain-containing protein [Megavirus baoshan]AZL89608.1 BTB/POZ domain-containing protein [Megavirus baoshan]
MDFNFLFNDLDQKIFTDLSLILSDNDNTITIDVHKIVLYCSCIYFRKILTFNETGDKIIKINVPNVYVARDIIESFYNKVWDNKSKSFIQIRKQYIENSIDYPEWKYTIELHKCNDYFGFDVDLNNIYYLQVPKENFDELLDFVDLIGYDNQTIQLLINNLPPNYDLTNLPKELLVVMSKILKSYCFVTLNNNKEIQVWNNGSDNQILNNMNHDINEKSKIYCSRDDSKIISIGHHSIKYIYGQEPINISDDNKIECMNTAKKIFFVGISLDRTTLVTVHHHITKIWNINTGLLINTLPLDANIFSMSVSPNGDFIIIVKYNFAREIWDCKNSKIVSYFDVHENKWKNTSNTSIVQISDILLNGFRDNCTKCYYHNNICFSPNNSEIAITYLKQIRIYNLISGELIKSLDTGVLDKLIYSPKGDQLMYFIVNKKIKIWTLATNKILISKYNVSIACYSPDGKYIIYSYKNNIYVWDIDADETIIYFQSKYHINDICFTPSLNNNLISQIENLLN